MKRLYVRIEDNYWEIISAMQERGFRWNGNDDIATYYAVRDGAKCICVDTEYDKVLMYSTLAHVDDSIDLAKVLGYLAAKYAADLAECTKELIVYKKVHYRKSPDSWSTYDLVVKMLIKSGTPRVMGEEKCRAASATILGYYSPKRNQKVKYPKGGAFSIQNESFIYPETGEVFSLDSLGEKYFHLGNKTCSEGIHFFRTYQEAANY